MSKWIWFIIAAVIVAAVLLLLAFLALFFTFSRRCEGNSSLKYFTSDDFDGLDASPIEFASNKGQILRGAVYERKDAGQALGLVIFSHGMGGGHLSYTREINTFASAGFKVLAYDNTGTMKSDGKSLRSFYQAVRDLKSAISFAKSDSELSKYKIILAGHSWGGYAVCQSVTDENAVGAVAFSAPNSVAGVICDNAYLMTGVNMDWMRPFFALASLLMSGIDAVHSSASMLMKTKKVPVLLLQGTDDKRVKLTHSPVSDEKLISKENISAEVYKGRAHNVYQTVRSEQYLEKVFGDIDAAKKKYGRKGIPDEIKKQIYDIDYERITEEDEAVMKNVTDFMKKCVSR